MKINSGKTGIFYSITVTFCYIEVALEQFDYLSSLVLPVELYIQVDVVKC